MGAGMMMGSRHVNQRTFHLLRSLYLQEEGAEKMR